MLSNLLTPADPVPAARLGRVHFAGIGGAGMSGIARIMLARGIGVSGSDARDSALLGELRELGASVHVGHAPDHLGHLGPGDTLVCRAPSARITRNWPRRPGAGCGWCTGRPRSPRSWPAAG